MSHLIWLAIAIAIVLSMSYYNYSINKTNVSSVKSRDNSKKIETFQTITEVQPTKCFSCEKELKHMDKYLSGPSKCFSCEKQLVNDTFIRSGALAQPTKCFSCESNLRW